MLGDATVGDAARRTENRRTREISRRKRELPGILLHGRGEGARRAGERGQGKQGRGCIPREREGTMLAECSLDLRDVSSCGSETRKH